MWKCGNCDKENQDKRYFCLYCTKRKDVLLDENSSGMEEIKSSTMTERLSSCPKCSSPLDEDAQFCPSCAEPVLLSSTINCPNCNKTVNAGAKFCKYCAANLKQKEEFKYGSQLNSQYSNSSFNSQKEKTERHQRIFVNQTNRAKKQSPFQIAEEKHRISANQKAEKTSFNSQKQKAEKLAAFGAILAVISAIAVFWGRSYTSNFANTARAGFENLMGQTDSTYQLAQFCILFGVIGLIVGIVLFIVGMSQR